MEENPKQEAREIWASQEAQKLLAKIVEAIRKGEPWKELLSLRPGYFYDVRNLVGADLTGVDFSGLQLPDIMFDYANLQDANFEKAFLKNSSFIGADMPGANLRGAFLEGIIFGSGDLRNADFSGAKLRGANFGLCDLRGANFSHADLENAMFRFAKNVSEANFEGVDTSKIRFFQE